VRADSFGGDRTQAIRLATLMVERRLWANASSSLVWLGPENRPIYAAIESGEPRVVDLVIAVGANVRMGWRKRPALLPVVEAGF
jgi:hypothetical protein